MEVAAGFVSWPIRNERMRQERKVCGNTDNSPGPNRRAESAPPLSSSMHAWNQCERDCHEQDGRNRRRPKKSRDEGEREVVRVADVELPKPKLNHA